jgi:hypothetical protein
MSQGSRLDNMKAQRLSAGYTGDNGLTRLAAKAAVSDWAVRTLEAGGDSSTCPHAQRPVAEKRYGCPHRLLHFRSPPRNLSTARLLHEQRRLPDRGSGAHSGETQGIQHTFAADLQRSSQSAASNRGEGASWQ